MLRVDAALRAMGHDVVLLPDGIDEKSLMIEIRDADLLLMCYTPVPASIIEAAKRRGIPVVNVPEYAEETVAEGAFALLLALVKKLKPIHGAMQTAGWAWPEAKWMGVDLAGKTLGIVGMGKIGSSMARMAGAFRMRVLGFDREQKNLKKFLAECDFVSIHCVLNEETRNLIGAAELAAMKPTAFLVNVSRGAIVDELALLRALQDKRIAGAALDVYSLEPLAKTGHPLSALYAMDNVILFPHLTFYTQEAMQRLEDETLERALEVPEGRPVLVKSRDPRLHSQMTGVRFQD